MLKLGITYLFTQTLRLIYRNYDIIKVKQYYGFQGEVAMNISKIAILEIKEKAFEEVGDCYRKHIEDYVGLNIDEFLDFVLQELENEVKDLVEIDRDILAVFEKNIRATKRRWVNKELNGGKGLYKEVEVIATDVYEKLKQKNSEEQFYEIYEAKTPIDLMKKRVIELNDWAQDINKHIASYRYIEYKKEYQIKRAIINDIKYIGLKILKEKYPTGNVEKNNDKKEILQFPETLRFPINYTNRSNIKLRKADKNLIESLEEIDKNLIDGKEYLIDKYYIDDERIFHSLVATELLEDIATEAVLSTLNATDIKVLMYLLSARDQLFYKTGEIIVETSEIVEEIYKSDNAGNYQAVRNSIHRLSSINSGVFTSSSMGFSVKIIDYFKILVSDNVEQIKVRINFKIVDDFVKSRTINMYKDIIANFKQDSAKILIFHLQRHRIAFLSDPKNEKKQWISCNMSFFRSALYFNNKKKNANIKVIEKALDEIVKSGITVKSYVRKGDVFYINFYPMSEKEKKDLLIDNKKELSLQTTYN
mgnify:CR=1 FL=1